MYKDCIYNSNFTMLLAVSSNITEIEYHPNVTYIENGAFATSLVKYITLPDTVTNLGQWSFYMMKFLEILILSPNIKFLDSYCFSFMKNLKEIIVPEGVNTISTSCFLELRNLVHITLPSNVTIQPNAFDNFFVKKAFIIDQNKKIDYIKAGVPASAFQPDPTCLAYTSSFDQKLFFVYIFILL